MSLVSPFFWNTVYVEPYNNFFMFTSLYIRQLKITDIYLYMYINVWSVSAAVTNFDINLYVVMTEMGCVFRE